MTRIRLHALIAFPSGRLYWFTRAGSPSCGILVPGRAAPADGAVA
jgi:hypothetical protein